MRIGIDARPLGPQRTGIGNYVYGLVQQLPRVAPEHDFLLYSNREIHSTDSEKNVWRRVDSRFRRIPGTLWLLGRGGRLARRDKLDVFWSTAAVLPLWIPKDVLKVVTVYDLVWRRFPETMEVLNLWNQRMVSEPAIRGCDRIVVISHSTGSDLTKFLGVPPERISLVYPSSFEEFKLHDPCASADHISRKYGVPQRYMAAVGTVEPRKNLSLLVRALQLLKRNGRLHCPLLIAGAKGWKNSHLFGEVRESGLTEKEIRFLGYMPNEDLPLFYAGAQVFLFPSFYEGFGIPLLEAMACGTPIIASNAEPMPEVLGDAGILEPPYSAERFAESMTKVLADGNLRCRMREQGINRVKTFRLEASARQLLAVLTAVQNGANVCRGETG